MLDDFQIDLKAHLIVFGKKTYHAAFPRKIAGIAHSQNASLLQTDKCFIQLLRFGKVDKKDVAGFQLFYFGIVLYYQWMAIHILSSYGFVQKALEWIIS